MSTFEHLRACAGQWSGTNRLIDPATNAPDDSPATALITSVLDGKFVRLDYTWSYRGEAQLGSFLIGYEAEAEVFSAYWIDTWHMGDKVMPCQGGANGDSIGVVGSYAAPPGPDWSWRTVITPAEGQRVRIIMYNIDPDGSEELAVEAEFQRSER